MANQPYIPLYTGDWKKDPKLSMCSPSTRGIWIDLLCSLHDARISQLTATPDQFARICRCDTGSMLAGLLELQSTGAANVSERDGMFTVVCRRMKRAEELSQKRQQAGSKRAANREQTPEYEIEDEGLEKVRGFAKGEGICPADADWFFWKEHANDWTVQRGSKTEKILDWKATLRSWFRAGYLPSQKANQNGGNGFKNGVRSMSVFEIDKRIEAINQEVNRRWKQNGGKRLNDDGIDELKTRKSELQKQRL